MRLVMDLLFIEELDFQISLDQGMRCIHTTKSVEDAAARACALVGIELVDYHSCVFRAAQRGLLGVTPTVEYRTDVKLRSKAWRERTERFAAAPTGL